MSNELKAMSLIKEIKQCHDQTFVKADEAIGWAIRCGELLTQSKAYLGHGEFGGFIEKYFDFSARTAQLYMKLHNDLGQLPNAKRLRLLKEAASVNSLQNLLSAPKPEALDTTRGGEPESPPETESSPDDPENLPVEPESSRSDSDSTPNDPFDGFDPDDFPETGQFPETEESRKNPGRIPEVEASPPPPSTGNGKPPKQYDRSFWLKQWHQNIGPLVRFVSTVADGVGEKQGRSHRAVKDHLEKATTEMMDWMGGKR